MGESSAAPCWQYAETVNSMEIAELRNFYERLDARFNVTNGDLQNASYTAASNFVLSANYARHRWFNYKEGFSPVLVANIFDEFGIDDTSVVCDPFCGAGTTLVAAKSGGVRSYGFEVNPFAAFISKIKTEDYTEKDIRRFKPLLDRLSGIEPDSNAVLPDNDYLCRIFDHEMLIAQLSIRNYINNLQSSKSKDLLFFVWICTLEQCSLYRKAGNGLKIKTRKPDYKSGHAFEFAMGKIKENSGIIISDFESNDTGPVPEIFTDSATAICEHMENGSLDLVLFSPPYANCFDYTKIYYLELWFGGFVNSTEDQKDIRMKSIRSHCHATWPERYENFHLNELNDIIIPLIAGEKLWTKRIPHMLNGYFADMEEALRQIFDALKPGGHCAIVVSNSAYAGIVVPTDVLLAGIAERLGFRVLEIQVERLIITSSQQYEKTEPVKRFLRESIVKLEK